MVTLLPKESPETMYMRMDRPHRSGPFADKRDN